MLRRLLLLLMMHVVLNDDDAEERQTSRWLYTLEASVDVAAAGSIYVTFVCSAAEASLIAVR